MSDLKVVAICNMLIDIAIIGGAVGMAYLLRSPSCLWSMLLILFSGMRATAQTATKPSEE